ncbi:hypothetical protein ACFSHP_12085 [Novosphingobium panipatense]
MGRPHADAAGSERRPETDQEEVLGGPSLPSAPPSAKRRGPFSKENLGQTLLDIGAGFLSGHNFSDGLGAAGKALSGRMDDLRAQEKAERPSIAYGGPDDRFEITTTSDGQRVIREVPEFAKVLDAKAAAERAPKTKDVIDQRARAIYSIGQLPESERAAAYATLMEHPEMFGGVDVTGMPPGYDPTYATVMGNMGTTVGQAITNDRAERALQVRTEQGAERLRQGQQRIDKPPASRRAPQTRPPAGFIWQ